MPKITAYRDRMRRVIAMLLALCVFAGIAAPLSFADEEALSLAFTDIEQTGATLTVTKLEQKTAQTQFPLYVVKEKGEPAPAEINSATPGVAAIQDGPFAQGSAQSASTVLDGLSPGTEYTVYAVICYMDYGAIGMELSYSEMASADFRTGSADPGTPAQDASISLSYRLGSSPEIRTDYYGVLKAAETALKDLESSCEDITLKLLSDISVSVGEDKSDAALTINRSCTLDLNGFTLSIRDEKPSGITGLWVYGDLDFILEDSSAEKDGRIDFDVQAHGSALVLGHVWNVHEAQCRGDVNFTMKGGGISATLRGSSCSFAITCAYYGAVKMEDGAVKGTVAMRGDFNMSGGSIESDAPMGTIVLQGSPEARSIAVSGGSIRNTHSADGGIVDNAAAISVVRPEACCDISISEGELASEEGPAVYITRNPQYAQTLTLSGGASLISSENAAVIFKCGHKAVMSGTVFDEPVCINIGEGVSLSGMYNAIKFVSPEEYGDYLTFRIEDGAYLRYAQDGIPVLPNSSLVIYPEGKVVDPDVIASGEYAGYRGFRNISEISQNLGTQTIGYQNMDDLNTAISGARAAYETGNGEGIYDSTLWAAFAAAYEGALPIPSNANANQQEIDYFRNRLGKAFAEMITNAESDIDLSNLADGRYAVEIEMWTYDFNNLSMSNTAVKHEATLTVKDGVPYIQVNFKPTFQAGVYGSLMQYWVYDGDTPQKAKSSSSSGQMTEAGYPLWHKVDMAYGSVTPLEGPPSQSPSLDNDIRPASVSFRLPYIGSSRDYNKIYSYVGVDVMRELGIGDQPVILYIKYHTLKELDVAPSIRLRYENGEDFEGGALSLIEPAEGGIGMPAKLCAGVAAGTERTGRIIGVEVEGSEFAQASVDGTGLVSITPVKAGSAIITVKAEAVNKEDAGDVIQLTKDIRVNVAGGGAQAVSVGTPSISGTQLSVSLAGDTLVNSQPGTDVSAGSVTLDISGFGSAITAADISMPYASVSALAGCGKPVKVHTDIADVSLDAALMDALASKGTACVLNIRKVANPDSSLYSAAYDIELLSAGSPADFSGGKATVTVPFAKASGYAYHMKAGKLAERITLNVDSAASSASWTTSHFSEWVVSESQYEVESAGGAGIPAAGSFLSVDGNYLVRVALWKSAADEESMGNVAFKNNSRALVTVSSGKVTNVEIATNPVDVGTYHSAIIAFKSDDAGRVEILEEGPLVTKVSGEKVGEYSYIKRASFRLPDSAQPKSSNQISYMDVSFLVPDTPMGNGYMDARLRFTWSSAKPTSDAHLVADVKTATGVDPLTGADIKKVNLVDAASGIKLDTDTSVIPENASLKVEKIASGTDYDKAVKAMASESAKWELYRITAIAGGKEIVPEGQVKISVPGDAELRVFRINPSGTRTVIKGELKGGYYVFNSSSLGLFAIAGSVAPARSAAADFSDVGSHWGLKGIEYAYAKGFMSGVAQKRFDPDGKLTRGMLVTVLHAIDGKPESGKASFADVSDSAWYAKAVSWASEKGITSGYASGGFKPNEAINREQTAVMLMAYAKHRGLDVSARADLKSYADFGDISPWAADALSWAKASGLMSGRSASSMAPKGSATRAETAAMLMNFLETLLKAGN